MPKIWHTKFKYKNDYICVICVANYDFNAYFCVHCYSKKHCEHIPIKCANCEAPHMANNRIYLEWQKVNPKKEYITPMDTNF